MFHIDGLIGDMAIVEIKCPYVARDTLSAIEAVNSKLVSHIKLPSYTFFKSFAKVKNNEGCIYHILYFIVAILYYRGKSSETQIQF